MTLAQANRIDNRKTYTSSEEDTIALFIAKEATKFGMSVGKLEYAFDNLPEWTVNYMAGDAPVRPATVTGAADARVKRMAIRYVREWTARRAQGAC